MSKLAVPVSSQDHIQGPETASLTLVEYGDFQCPSCGDAYVNVKDVQKHFGDRLRFVFRNFPLPMHPFAEPAAETAEFAAAHGNFWQMHDALYENQRHFTAQLFPKLAEKLGLSSTELETALSNHKFKPRVETDLESGEDSQVRGTPTFFINGKQFEGDYDADSLIEALQSASPK